MLGQHACEVLSANDPGQARFDERTGEELQIARRVELFVLARRGVVKDADKPCKVFRPARSSAPRRVGHLVLSSKNAIGRSRSSCSFHSGSAAGAAQMVTVARLHQAVPGGDFSIARFAQALDTTTAHVIYLLSRHPVDWSPVAVSQHPAHRHAYPAVAHLVRARPSLAPGHR
ncbi:hypothetical protein ACFY1L_55175 [Streptomyces sp. NPDC001663]|uniref:hypothetical protein n=1 Tax=Streptomyces sp. NPDC001663 TaxID=3364597 RepID=UPI0036807CFB